MPRTSRSDSAGHKKALALLFTAFVSLLLIPSAHASITWSTAEWPLNNAKRIRKTHIDDLVSKILQTRSDKCSAMPAITFTGDLTWNVATTSTAITPGTTTVKLSHYTQLRAAINSIYQQANAGASYPFSANPSVGEPIRAAHFNELQTALNAIQAGPPCAVCGNGIVEFGEACDTGSATATCNANCTVPACGNGVVEPNAGENCEPPGAGVCDAACHGCTGPPTIGNGFSMSCDANFRSCTNAMWNCTITFSGIVDGKTCCFGDGGTGAPVTCGDCSSGTFVYSFNSAGFSHCNSFSGQVNLTMTNLCGTNTKAYESKYGQNCTGPSIAMTNSGPAPQAMPADCSATCNNNGIQDNGEAGVDCGGGGCGSCGSCGDNICSGSETGITCPNDCCTPWSNGNCGVNGCWPTERERTRSCQGGGALSQCVTDGSCGGPCGDGTCSGGETGVTCPIDCCTAWSPGACGAGGCGTTQRQQTRTCQFGGANTQCLPDSTCGGGPCGDGTCSGGETGVSCPQDCCSSWSPSGSCGAGGCSATQRPQTRTCTGGGTTNQCVSDVPGCGGSGGSCDNDGICEAGENGANCGGDCCDAQTPCFTTKNGSGGTLYCRNTNGAGYGWVTAAGVCLSCDQAGEECVSTSVCNGTTYYCNNASACGWSLSPCSCGNGVKEGTEQCDSGSASNGPCPKSCSSGCTSNLPCPCAPPTNWTFIDCGGACGSKTCAGNEHCAQGVDGCSNTVMDCAFDAGCSCGAQTINDCALSVVNAHQTSGTCTNGTTGTCSYTCQNGGGWTQNSNNCTPPVCAPNSTQGCDPGTGCAGEETCNASGTAWGPCVPTEVMCYESTYSAMFSGDTWDKDDICTDDPCDPWHHCWGGNSAFGGQWCDSTIQTATSLAAARSQALSHVLATCTSRAGNGRCGYKDPFDGTEYGNLPGGKPAGCASCCHDITREAGATNYVCIGEVQWRQYCEPGSSCPVTG